MDYKRAKEEIKPRLLEYVQSITQKSKGQSGNYNCPICGSGQKKNHTGAFSVYDGGLKWKCHACGRGGDIFDLIGEYEQIGEPVEQLKRAAAIFNITLDEAAAGRGTSQSATASDYMKFYKVCAANLKDCDYLSKRFISEELQKKYMIGFCPDWKSPKALAEGKNPPPSARIIIPTSKNSYLARATDPGADPQYSKLKVGKTTPFNHKCMATAQKPIYIVEGEIDALSIIQAGGEAIGLGSIEMVDKFLTEYLDLIDTETPPFIVALDNDGKENTKRASDKLAAGLQQRGKIYIVYNPCGEYKDANDALCGNPGQFEQDVKEGEAQARQALENALEEERAAYREEHTAAGHLPEFLREIRKTAQIQSTGTGCLDEVLSGGLDMGLCFIGAISSLGKTTFCLQLADQIAAQGRDIIFYSLEMPISELISKSLSRLSFLDSLAKSGDAKTAATSRGILRSYEDLYTGEKESVTTATEKYKSFADHLYFFEGVGDIGAAQIRDTVEEHKRITGNTPIIFIDYVQILAPYNERYTDKMNTDKAVIELKRISRDFNTTIIAISSFNRDNYTSPVNMASFKESGAIEYSSDILIGLQYDGMDYVPGESEKDRNSRIRSLIAEQLELGKQGGGQTIQLKVLKNRNGSRGSATLKYYPRYNYFEDENQPNIPF